MRTHLRGKWAAAAARRGQISIIRNGAAAPQPRLVLRPLSVAAALDSPPFSCWAVLPSGRRILLQILCKLVIRLITLCSLFCVRADAAGGRPDRLLRKSPIIEKRRQVETSGVKSTEEGVSGVVVKLDSSSVSRASVKQSSRARSPAPKAATTAKCIVHFSSNMSATAAAPAPSQPPPSAPPPSAAAPATSVADKIRKRLSSTGFAASGAGDSGDASAKAFGGAKPKSLSGSGGGVGRGGGGGGGRGSTVAGAMGIAALANIGAEAQARMEEKREGSRKVGTTKGPATIFVSTPLTSRIDFLL